MAVDPTDGLKVQIPQYLELRRELVRTVLPSRARKKTLLAQLRARNRLIVSLLRDCPGQCYPYRGTVFYLDDEGDLRTTWAQMRPKGDPSEP